jgi:non-canonical purine NTP pyrophosphatase (RdgB/HAM1 family)
MLATSNPGKVREFQALLGQYEVFQGLTLLTPKDWPETLPEVEETGATFAENARLKAVALASATGLPALADDSGLCVDMLDGQPGLYSARWAGDNATDADRNALLLARLLEVPAEKRTARYVCAVSLAYPDSKSVEATGTCDGLILETPRGANGFGYDPLFLLPEFGRTMAELTEAEKNLVSHRAAALAALDKRLNRVRAGYIQATLLDNVE